MQPQKFLSTLLACALVLGLTACGGQPASGGTPSSSAPVDESAAYLATLTNEEKSWMGLTTPQYLEDFDALYRDLQENYPYFGVAKRKAGVDIPALYESCREQVARCKNDYDFFQQVRNFTNQVAYTGHLHTWGYSYREQRAGYEQLVVDFPEYADQLAPYLERLDNPLSPQFYRGLEALDSRVAAHLTPHNLGPIPIDNNEVEELREPEPNVETQILREGEVAYVRIGAFDMESYRFDEEVLLPFYESLSGYDHLIIDITENGGGGMNYFNDLVVAPLITETKTVPTYCLAKGGADIRYFLQLEQDLAAGIWQPIEELPTLPKMNGEDLAAMAYFSKEDYTVEPLSKTPTFTGRIWLLVSEQNYSSSEYAAMFAKHSGFATLVGTPTGGDGIGTDPIYSILPNTGIVVQYSPIYGATADGASSEEHGTQPHILKAESQTALTACLTAIDATK